MASRSTSAARNGALVVAAMVAAWFHALTCNAQDAGGSWHSPISHYSNDDLDIRLKSAESTAFELLANGHLDKALEMMAPIVRLRESRGIAAGSETPVRLRQLSGALASNPDEQAEVQDALRVLYGELSQYRTRGDFNDGAEAALSVADRLERAVGVDSIDAAHSRLRSAWLYRQAGRLDDAVQQVSLATAAFKRALGDRHPTTLEATIALAECLRLDGRMGDAKAVYAEAIDAVGDHLPLRGAPTLGLASIAHADGAFTEAKQLLTRLRQDQEAAGIDPLILSETLHLLAQVHHAAGEYRDAESLYWQTLSIRQVQAGKWAEFTLPVYHNLAGLFLRYGDFRRAETLYRSLLNALDGRSAEWDLERASVLNNLGLTLREVGDTPAAIQAFSDALHLRESRLSPADERIAITLANLAPLVIEGGDLDRGIDMLARATDLVLARRGRHHPYTLRIRSNYAAALARVPGREDDAVRILDETVLLGRKTGGPYFLQILLNRAQFALGQQHDSALAERLFEEACAEAESNWEGFRADAIDRARYFSESDALDAYRGLSRAILTQVPGDPCGVRSGSGVSRAFVALDRSRARELSAALARHEALLERVPERLQRLVEEARREHERAETELAALSADSSEAGMARVLERLRDAKARHREARRAAVAASGTTESGPPVVDLECLRERLDPLQLVLAFDVGPTQSALYLLAKDGDPTVVCLRWPDGTDVTAETLRTQHAAAFEWLKGELVEPAHRADSVARLEQLADSLIPASVRDLVLSKRELIVIADDVVHATPIEYLLQLLPQDSAPSVTYAPSAAILTVSSIPKHQVRRMAYLFGNPQYESMPPSQAPAGELQGVFVAWVMPDTAAAMSGLAAGDVVLSVDGEQQMDAEALLTHLEERRQGLIGVPPVALAVERNGRILELSLDFPFSGMRLCSMPVGEAVAASKLADVPAAPSTDDWIEAVLPDTLPGAQLELAGARATLSRALGADQVVVREWCDATRSEVEQCAPDARWLHLAVHGMANPNASDSSLQFARCPLTDGYSTLTVADILFEWPRYLAGTELVVLSACETGSGQVERGEGGLSIGWAMMTAGAQTVVVSRWRVDDDATALLMTKFYEVLFAGDDTGAEAIGIQRHSPSAALTEASRWLRSLSRHEADQRLAELRTIAKASEPPFDERPPRSRDPRRRAIAPSGTVRPYEHPSYWAAFSVISRQP
ncbi:MAG: CHAT domain-containing protein [Planctomycetota bacterium]